jgi:hypothetical protein
MGRVEEPHAAGADRPRPGEWRSAATSPNATDSGQRHGEYANYFQVGFNTAEFVLDFGQYYPESLEPRIHTRIVTGPAYAQELLRILQKSIDEFRQAFGPTLGDRNAHVREEEVS